MAKTDHYYTKFEPGNFYHVYNRSIDKRPMFVNDNNYVYFLKKYDEYLSPVLETYAYNLLGNHFHLMVRIRDLTTFEKLSNLTPAKSCHDIVSHQFRKFFQSYAMAFNKQQDRTGTLFQTPFKRARIDNDIYFTRLVYYIHTNAQHHKIVKGFKAWPWSSYSRILIDKETNLQKFEVLNWFGGKEKFLQYHQEHFEILSEDKILFEDE